MYRLVSILCLILSAALASVVQAQTRAPENSLAWPATRLAPRSELALAPGSEDPAGSPFVQPAGWQEPVQPAAPATAVPPADPAPPRWGNYAMPPSIPVRLPAVDYALEGPPIKIFQPTPPLEYHRPVVDAESVVQDDATLTQPIDLARPDGLAPMGVWGAETLRTGHATFSYRYLQNVFEDNFAGPRRVSDASIGANFPFVPARRFSGAQVAALAYGVTDDLTLLATLPFIRNQIDYSQVGGGNLRAAFNNPGDITLNTLYVLRRAECQQLHLNFGLSVPVGFLDYATVLPSPTFPNLPYALRTSSGTYDLLPGLTYRGQSDRWTWGSQLNGIVRLGVNRLNYKLGDQVSLTAWASRRWTDRWSTSARVEGRIWGNVRGSDPRLDPTLSPTNVSTAKGGDRIDLLFGVNYFLPAVRIPGQLISVEAGCPVYQSLEGPQLGLNWVLNAGWTILF